MAPSRDDDVLEIGRFAARQGVEKVALIGLIGRDDRELGWATQWRNWTGAEPDAPMAEFAGYFRMKPSGRGSAALLRILSGNGIHRRSGREVI